MEKFCTNISRVSFHLSSAFSLPREGIMSKWLDIKFHNFLTDCFRRVAHILRNGGLRGMVWNSKDTGSQSNLKGRWSREENVWEMKTNFILSFEHFSDQSKTRRGLCVPVVSFVSIGFPGTLRK